MVTVRRFVEGVDEAVWLRIQNAAYSEYEDVRPDTLEDMEIAKKSPTFDSTGMFIAELEGKPVGVVNAFVDRHRTERVGSLRVLGVLREFRGQGVGRRLLETAIASLNERGMESVQAWTRDRGVSCKSPLAEMGFALTRTFCSMRADLQTIPYNVGEHESVIVREMAMRPEDIELVRGLHNEAFKDHFHFRPRTSEEYQFWLTHKPWGCDIIGVFIAYVEAKPVGFVEAGIDTPFVKQKSLKRGWILSMGVLEPSRGKGVGTALMQHAMEYLKAHGMTDVELGVDAANPTHAIELYKKIGFKTVRKNLAYTKQIR